MFVLQRRQLLLELGGKALKVDAAVDLGVHLDLHGAFGKTQCAESGEERIGSGADANNETGFGIATKRVLERAEQRSNAISTQGDGQTHATTKQIHRHEERRRNVLE